MQSTQSWFAMEPVRRSRRDLWLGLIRTVIVVAVIGSAARMIALAYWPQWSAPRAAVQELVCPPLPAINPDPVLSPQPLVTTAESNISDRPAGLLVSESAARMVPIVKREAHRSASKRPATIAVAPKIVAPPHTMSVVSKRGGTGANPPKSKSASAAPMLAQTGSYASPFGDMHGQ